jgi:putative spermidine/putrescine transport system permease protein
MAAPATGTRARVRSTTGRSRLRARPGWLVLPALALIVVCFLYPVGVILARSVTSGAGGLSHYEVVFGNELYLQVLLRTVRIAALVTVVTFLLAYPYAYLAATTGPRARMVLLALVATPLIISLLVRSYGWLVLLDRNGLVGWLLRETGIADRPPALVHNTFGVVVGLVQYALPLMVLPLYSAMRQYDQRLTQAAETLGAGRLVIFMRVYFPQTVPGVVAGASIVFVSSLGYYIAPAILGSSRTTMLGELIAEQVTTTLNWGLASALATLLLVTALAGFVLFYRFSEGKAVKARRPRG